VGKRAKRLVSYQLSLAIVIPLLVIATGALVAGVSYASTRSSIRASVRSLFAQITDQTADQASTHLQAAAPAVDMLVHLAASDGEPVSDQELVRRELLVLRANPGFSWVSFADPAGAFTGVHRRPDGTLIIKETRFVDGKSVLDEHAVDGTPIRSEADSGYDPRTRPFYVRATAAKALVWTDPYVFFDEAVPGITCAAPVYGSDGALRGVVSVDFDLNSLSAFVATLHASPHARVFIYTDDGLVLAHPTAQVITRGAHGAGKLVTADDLHDEALRAYVHAGAPETFSSGGERYLATARPFSPGAGLHWHVGVIAPEADFTGALERMTRDILLVSIVVIVIAVVFALTFARRVARPLVHLAKEMDRVGQFELDGEDPPPSRYREIEMMNHALVRTRKGLASFGVYVPRDLVRAVLASGQRAELGGKTRPMSVFFSDLAGFTSLSETMRPAELVELLGVYFDEMSTVITAHHGTIDKFIGDAIMAFWNAPTDDADHALHACAAALAFQTKLDEIKRRDPSLAGLSARIGIASGDVVVGNIGAHQRMNYTVMGDTVNLASRLEGLGKAYGTKILISEGCRRAAGDGLIARAIDVVAVKGKSHGVRVYEPLALASQADDAARAVAALSMQAFDAYLARRWSDAGALYDEIGTRLPGDAAARAMKARCVAYAAAPPPMEWTGTHVMHEK
jgi:adenylate cyclase